MSNVYDEEMLKLLADRLYDVCETFALTETGGICTERVMILLRSTYLVACCRAVRDGMTVESVADCIRADHEALMKAFLTIMGGRGTGERESVRFDA